MVLSFYKAALLGMWEVLGWLEETVPGKRLMPGLTGLFSSMLF